MYQVCCSQLHQQHGTTKELCCSRDAVCMARHACHHCFHLRCLQICTCMLVGKNFPPHALKKVGIHHLTRRALSSLVQEGLPPVTG